MRKSLAYVYICFLLGVWVWLILSNPRLLIKIAIGVGILGLVFLLGVLSLYLLDMWRKFRYDRRLSKLLGHYSLNEVLERSPYEYGYVFQGDDGYRLWRKDSPTNFIFDQFLSQEDAVLWIVEQFMSHDSTPE